ncbi:acetyltransferase [Streptococcus suis]|uniref:acetyltransferase n=1 Tax=Streptococcus suis TaxID=1307 RepID=UPI001554AE14|nr:acetyltransferase [Streptococcus suis]NQL61370.1 acetyltransferase [Streptococcus suis]NQO46133.1 acetyltransferase [Streptococcus suis]UUM58703.1 acetyltransferase [Streptococcus suis]WNF85122.1 acetyltransferase [Streptococcus suis]
MKKLAIIGASGHGKVVADIAEKNGYNEIVFLDDYSTGECAGYPIVGTSQIIEELSDFEFIVAIGDNKIRASKQCMLPQDRIATLIHPSAVISRRVDVHAGTVIMAGAVINSDVTIGRGCIINTASSVDHDCKLGDFVHLSPGCHIAGNVSIGHGSWLGIGSTIIQSISICKEVIVGAGGVVIYSIDRSGTYVGNPCRKVN